MEEEHADKQKLVREKREVERQMQTLSEQKPARDRGPVLIFILNAASFIKLLCVFLCEVTFVYLSELLV